MKSRLSMSVFGGIVLAIVLLAGACSMAQPGNPMPSMIPTSTPAEPLPTPVVYVLEQDLTWWSLYFEMFYKDQPRWMLVATDPASYQFNLRAPDDTVVTVYLWFGNKAASEVYSPDIELSARKTIGTSDTLVFYNSTLLFVMTSYVREGYSELSIKSEYEISSVQRKDQMSLEEWRTQNNADIKK